MERNEQTFDTFIAGSCNRGAFAAAKNAANNWGHPYNPLTLYGKPGTGKTHMLKAIGHSFQKMHPAAHIALMTGEALVDAIIQKERQGEILHLKGLDLLLVDDIDCVVNLEACQDELGQVLDEFIRNGHQVVMTSSVDLSFMPVLDNWLRDHTYGLAVKLAPLDKETATAVLLRKAECQSLHISREEAERLVEDITDARRIEGLIQHLHNQSEMICE